MGKGYFGKAVRGFMETRHDRLGREKIVISGRMGPCGDTKERRLLLEGPLWVLFRYQAFVLRGRRPSLRELRFLLKGSLFDRDRDVGILVLHLNDLAPRSRCHRLIQLLC